MLPLCIGLCIRSIRFSKTDGCIRIYDGTRYLTLFGTEKYYSIYNRIKCLKSKIRHHVYFFTLFCKNQSWFLWYFACRKNVDFG